MDILSILTNFLLRTKPEHFLLAATILILIILLLALSIKAAKKRNEAKHGAKKKFIFRKILIALLVIVLIASVSCAVLSFIVRKNHVTEMATIEIRENFTHYLVSVERDGSNYSCYYYSQDGRIRNELVPTNNASIEFITNGSAPRLVSYTETPVKTEYYKDEQLNKFRTGQESNYFVLYIPQGTINQSFTLH